MLGNAFDLYLRSEMQVFNNREINKILISYDKRGVATAQAYEVSATNLLDFALLTKVLAKEGRSLFPVIRWEFHLMNG
tara:strand:- start:247 stop:480 length:234 start_codon:yes stop_codon:yes gene_type:complete